MNVNIEMTAHFSKDEIEAILREWLGRHGYTMEGQPRFNLTTENSGYWDEHGTTVFKDVEVKIRERQRTEE